MKVDKTFIDASLPRPELNGTDIPHTPDFVIDRPCDPFGTNLVFSFRSNGIIRTVRGIEMASSGDCIIHSLPFPQYHAGAPGEKNGYRNDFIHLPPHMCAPFMKETGLPYDTLIPTANPEILTGFIKDLQIELLCGDGFSGAMIGNITERMFLAIARAKEQFAERERRITHTERHYFPRFCELRERMRRTLPGRCETVGTLAASVNLSPERFAVLYKSFFGAAPYAELTEARISNAKRLLIYSDMSVKEIASECGWEDMHYFSRIFKRKTGVTPSEFRNPDGVG